MHGAFENDFLEKIKAAVTAEYGFPVEYKISHTDLSDFYDPFRRQYDGNKILQSMDASTSPEYLKTIGLFTVDLFIPILTFIFGQAVFKGKTGIVSLYRLRNEQYGLHSDEQLLFERFRKVIIHELGHTFGLIHCHNPTCVMRSTTYAEEIDQKEYHLCANCRRQLNL